jgi:hypothetical protein
MTAKTCMAIILLAGIVQGFDGEGVPPAQYPADPVWWVSFGSGASLYDIMEKDEVWLSGMFEITRRHGKNMLTMRWMGIAEPTSPFGEGPHPGQYAKELSIMIGSFARVRAVRISICTGLSYVYGLKRGAWLGSPGYESYDHEKLVFQTFGFPFEAQLTILDRNFGLGLCAFANLNNQCTFAGLMLCMQFGKHGPLE